MFVFCLELRALKIVIVKTKNPNFENIRVVELTWLFYVSTVIFMNSWNTSG